MHEILIVTGLFVLAVALRTSRQAMIRKLGALAFLVASFVLVYFPTRSVFAGLAGVSLWFFLPWIELLTRIRRMKLPVNNRLMNEPLPDPAFFPNANEATAAMEEAGFEHVTDCGWEWSGMHQFFRLFWHPEERAVAAVCLCEQSDVAFAFVSVTSENCDGRVWRTTNFPFAPTLKNPAGIRLNYVPCEKNCFHQILEDHRNYLSAAAVYSDDLRMPDPDMLVEAMETEMREQIDHNLKAGVIRLTDDGHFCYSFRGLLFLWGQFIKDMIKLC